MDLGKLSGDLHKMHNIRTFEPGPVLEQGMTSSQFTQEQDMSILV